ncbi:hypothetical protein J3Q09_13020 [Pseudomonas sp. R4-83]|uniref:hypothetical protein n=1 Tax=unclassified Pseudomonas TaxID=196821 RepID=UPI003DA7B126
MTTDDEVTSSNATGLFKVKTDLRGIIRPDHLIFSDLDSGFTVIVAEGVGGTMEPKKRFVLTFPRKDSYVTSDARDLVEVKYDDWSDMYDFQYSVESGSVTVSYEESPRATIGMFNLVMKIIPGNVPPGPERLKISGFFLLNEKPA